MTVRFDVALKGILEVLANHREALRDAGEVVVVRDLLGRARLACERRVDLAPEFLSDLALRGGRFFVTDVLFKDDLLDPQAIFDSPDAWWPPEADVRVVERVVTAAEWSRGPLQNEPPTPPRATLYGMKGGVGRSTALAVWAWYLASLGRRVLVVDLDLESPGVSSSLLPPDRVPTHGVVDWFVEDAVGNADGAFVRDLAVQSPLADQMPGKIYVVTCGDTRTGAYLDKLARVYLDLPPRRLGAPGEEGRKEPFGRRLAKLVDALEDCWGPGEDRPDVVLLDSRAGLHDLAGVATTRLGAMTFLFAVDSRQTWAGYRALFERWRRYREVGAEVRKRLKMVAAQVPETGVDAYLASFRTHAYDLFSETLYDDPPDEADAPENTPFNFDLGAIEAPHQPLRIDWSRALQTWDPLSLDVTPDKLDAAMGDFLRGATELLLPGLQDVGSGPGGWGR